MRSDAADALGKRRDARATAALVEALDDADVRVAAAGALGKIRDPRAVPRLVELLDDESTWVQGTSARALGEVGDNQALLPLLEKSRAPGTDRWVRRASAAALRKLGYEDPESGGETLPFIAWLIGVLLLGAAIALGATIGPWVALPFAVGLGLLVVYYVRWIRLARHQRYTLFEGEVAPAWYEDQGRGDVGGGDGGSG